MTTSTKQSTTIPFIIIGVMFGIFGFVTWVNSILIPFMQTVCELSTKMAYLVTFASYISFVVMALPSSFILNKIGYKNGMSVGLLTMALGALVFVPAASERAYPLFLVGIFMQGAGMTLLQTACNPYVTLLGPIESAAKRISIMGICNKFAGSLGSKVLGGILLSGAALTVTELAKMTPEAKEALLDESASKVVMPYVVMAIVLGIFGVLIRFAPLPEMVQGDDSEEENGTEEVATEKTSIFQFPQLWLGVLALFFYVGLEVIAVDTIPSYAKAMQLENPENNAS